jgi:hypothetical protein
LKYRKEFLNGLLRILLFQTTLRLEFKLGIKKGP